MEEKIKQLEAEIELLKERNRKVEENKKWETSNLRKVLIAITTYFVMCLVMYSIKVEDFYISAIVPTLGFLLSTLSFELIRKYFVKN